ncbi:MAG: hypothetical protein JJU45_14640 [Acidimicrobiia bacterium]|nr:hypothetical protein [Acidimicrobiia bacterium]
MNPFETAKSMASDSFYVSVGFGVLVFQRLQVQRRDIEKTLARHRQQVDSTLRKA